MQIEEKHRKDCSPYKQLRPFVKLYPVKRILSYTSYKNEKNVVVRVISNNEIIVVRKLTLKLSFSLVHVQGSSLKRIQSDDPKYQPPLHHESGQGRPI